jgi:hypothetical protein
MKNRNWRSLPNLDYCYLYPLIKLQQKILLNLSLKVNSPSKKVEDTSGKSAKDDFVDVTGKLVGNPVLSSRVKTTCSNRCRT